MPPPSRITSRQHAIVHRFRDVARRAAADVVLLDGEHLVTEALDAGVSLELLLTDGRFQALAGRVRASGASVYEGSADVLEAASPVRAPSGIVALARWQPASLGDALSGEQALVLGLCGVQDPGNVGSAVRAADALGATAVLALEHTANPGGWKALRGAMGSTFHLPIALGLVGAAVDAARAGGLRVAATVATHGSAPHQIDLRQPTLLLLGSEGAGLSDTVVAQCDARLTIPMRPGVNSLNVAATAALLLYEARRQRTGTP